MFIEIHSDKTVYYVPVATTLCTKGGKECGNETLRRSGGAKF